MPTRHCTKRSRSRNISRERIRTARQLTATIGIAANKLLAKIASDHQKPDGLTLIAERDKVSRNLSVPCPSARSTASAKKPRRF